MAPSREVILLTSEDCAFCEDADEILGRLRIEYGFELTRIDMRSPRGVELARVGRLLFPPGIVIDGEPFCYGRPSERRLRRKLAPGNRGGDP